MSLRSRKRRRWARRLAREGWRIIKPGEGFYVGVDFGRDDGISRVYVAPCRTDEARLVQGMLDAPAPPAGPFTVTPRDEEQQR